MICKFCGVEFAGNPVMQNNGIYCSVGCADMADEINLNDECYSEQDYNLESESDFSYEEDDGVPF